MRTRADAVVIGGGHNGLTAACYLARAGKSVVVLERARELGGVAAGYEFAPGYRTAGLLHDTSGVRASVIEDLNLTSHGLTWSSTPAPVYAVGSEGSGLLLHHAPGRAHEGIARFSARDADRYGSYRAFNEKIQPLLRRWTESPPPAVPSGFSLGLLKQGLDIRRLGKETLLELARVGPMCVADWLNEWFETEVLKGAMAFPAITSTFGGPWSPGTAANLLLWESAVRGRVAGGPAALVAALASAAEKNGVEIRKECAVQEIVFQQGRPRAVWLADGTSVETTLVLASCDPRHTFLDLIPSREIPLELEERTGHIRGYGTAAKVHLGLEGPFELEGGPEENVASIRMAGTLDEMERAFDPVKYDALPPDPILDVFIPTVEEPHYAPDGHTVVSVLVQYVPYRLEGGWNQEAKDRLGEIVVKKLSRVAPGLASRIKALEVVTPVNMEEWFGLVQGHLYHGDHAVDQLLVRPNPECAYYRTPVQGLFLCGSGSHPGGGVTCAPGRLGAAAATG